MAYRATSNKPKRPRGTGNVSFAVCLVLGVAWLWYCMAEGERNSWGSGLGLRQLVAGYGGVYVKRADGTYVFVGNNVMRKIPSGQFDKWVRL